MTSPHLTLSTDCLLEVERLVFGPADGATKVGARVHIWHNLATPQPYSKDAILSAMANAVVSPRVCEVELRQVRLTYDPHTSNLTCLVRGYDASRCKRLVEQLITDFCDAISYYDYEITVKTLEELEKI